MYKQVWGSHIYGDPCYTELLPDAMKEGDDSPALCKKVRYNSGRSSALRSRCPQKEHSTHVFYLIR